MYIKRKLFITYKKLFYFAKMAASSNMATAHCSDGASVVNIKRSSQIKRQITILHFFQLWQATIPKMIMIILMKTTNLVSTKKRWVIGEMRKNWGMATASNRQ